MRDSVEEPLNNRSQALREKEEITNRTRSSRRSKSRANSTDQPAVLVQILPQPIKEAPVLENVSPVQRPRNGSEETPADDQSPHAKHVKRKRQKSKRIDADEPLGHINNQDASAKETPPSVSPTETAEPVRGRRRDSSQTRPRTAHKDITSTKSNLVTLPLEDLVPLPPALIVLDKNLEKLGEVLSPVKPRTSLLADITDDNVKAKVRRRGKSQPDEKPESSEVAVRAEKTIRRRSKAPNDPSSFPAEPNMTIPEHINTPSSLPVSDEAPEVLITDKSRTLRHQQQTRPSPIKALVPLIIQPPSEPTIPEDANTQNDDSNEKEQTDRKNKKHGGDKKKHRRKTKDMTSEGELQTHSSVDKHEHEPLKPPRPPLVLSPSDAAAFQRPEPPPNLGPSSKRPPTVHKKVPQTALLMGMTRRNKVTPYDSSVLDKRPSQTDQEILIIPLARSSALLQQLQEDIAESEKDGKEVPAVDSVLSERKIHHKPKREKKGKSHRSKSEMKKRKSAEEISLHKSEIISSPVEVMEKDTVKEEVEIEEEKVLPAENNEEDEGDQESMQRSRKGKKKKKKRRDDESGQLNADEETGKKKKKKRKARDATRAEDSKQNVDNEKQAVEPTESDLARLADELYGKAVGNFFILEDVLGKGGFGEARRGKHITTGKKYAIKLERASDGNESLADEYKIYQILGQHIGFPRCYYFGVGPKNSNALVMDLLGPSLEDYFRAMDRQWSLKTICLVALQILERIEYVHSKGYVYSDIKPENFLVGLPEEHQDSTVFLIDFGLAQQFKDKDTGKYCYDENLKTHPVGTMRYMSVRSHEARSLSYRDDLESIGYLIIYFIRGRLPWQASGIKDRAKKVKAVGLKKKSMTMEELCEECPTEIQEYMKYVRSVQFYAEPKYERLRNFFSHILTANKWTDDGQFDWIGNSYDFSKMKKSESLLGKPPEGTTAEDDTVKPEHRVLVGTPVAVINARPEKVPQGIVKTPSAPESNLAASAPKKAKPPKRAVAKAKKSKVAVARLSLPVAGNPAMDPVATVLDKELEKPSARIPTTSSYNSPSTNYDKPTRRKKDESSCACC